MMRLLAAAVVGVAVLSSGLVQGLWAGRWGNSRAVEQAVARLPEVPLAIGGVWDGEGKEIGEREQAIAEIRGYLSRRYVNRRTGAVVSLLLVSGRPGPISVHPPDVCYRGAGYDQVGATSHYVVPSGPAEGADFQVLHFRKQDVTAPGQLRIFLAWGSEGRWSAPANPRWAFARKPYLHKIYLVREVARPDEPVEQDPALQLFRDLTPSLQETLFPGA